MRWIVKTVPTRSFLNFAGRSCVRVGMCRSPMTRTRTMMRRRGGGGGGGGDDEPDALDSVL
jgi:hypothetical protein